MNLVGFDEIQEGMRFTSVRRTISDADILAFAGVSGDFNPLHMDEIFIREQTPFDQRIAQGLLGVAIGSGLTSDLDRWFVLAYLECTRQFPLPLVSGDTVWVEYEVSGVRASRSKSDRGIVTLDVRLVNQERNTVQKGTDVLLVGRVATPVGDAAH